MKTTDIKPDTKNIKEIIELYETAFPPNERYSPEEIFSLLEQDKNVKYKAFYDEDELIGSMLFAVSDSVLYLLYMVVSEKKRSHGIGAKFILWLRENYPGKVISVDIEPRNHTSDNTYQRERRFKFYAKNGFSDTGWRVTVDGGVYVIMCSQPEPPSNEVISELKELILKLDTAMCPEAEIPVLFINTNIRLSINNLHSHIYWED